MSRSNANMKLIPIVGQESAARHGKRDYASADALRESTRRARTACQQRAIERETARQVVERRELTIAGQMKILEAQRMAREEHAALLAAAEHRLWFAQERGEMDVNRRSWKKWERERLRPVRASDATSQLQQEELLHVYHKNYAAAAAAHTELASQQRVEFNKEHRVKVAKTVAFVQKNAARQTASLMDRRAEEAARMELKHRRLEGYVLRTRNAVEHAREVMALKHLRQLQRCVAPASDVALLTSHRPATSSHTTPLIPPSMCELYGDWLFEKRSDTQAFESDNGKKQG